MPQLSAKIRHDFGCVYDEFNEISKFEVFPSVRGQKDLASVYFLRIFLFSGKPHGNYEKTQQ